MTAVFGRLTYLATDPSFRIYVAAMRQQRRTIEIDPKRGTIYDRNMRPLAMSVPVQSAFAIPSEIKDTTMAARLLSGCCGFRRIVCGTSWNQAARLCGSSGRWRRKKRKPSVR